MAFVLVNGKFIIPKSFSAETARTYWTDETSLQWEAPDIQKIEFTSNEGTKHHLIELSVEHINHDHFEFLSLRDLLMKLPGDEFMEAAKAWQYSQFLRNHQHCGRCGTKTSVLKTEMATECNSCGFRCYPRISPCIIVCIKKDDKILLAQGVNHQASGFYSTLAGFVESAESLEQAVHREVYEEVGIFIKNLRYFASQPWPFPHSLMCGYLADYSSGEIEPDNEEILAADWFDVDALPKTPPRVSIAGQLIDQTIKEIKQKYA